MSDPKSSFADAAADIAVHPAAQFEADDENWRASIERLRLGAGMQVFLNDIQAHRDLRAEPMADHDAPYLFGQVTLRGRLTLDFRDGTTANAAPDTALLYRRAVPPVHGFFAHSRFRSIGYSITLPRIERLFGGDVPTGLRPLLDGKRLPRRCVAARSRAPMRALARTLLDNNLSEPLRRIMAEGIVLQLLAMHVAAGSELRPTLRDELSPRERSAVQEARERLLADMRHPPSLGELAEAVGLSERRLNAGFRLLFGATVFETLCNQRLEHARELLEAGATSLKVIAFRVGYNHVTNFVNAYRARYGKPPRQHIARRGEGT